MSAALGLVGVIGAAVVGFKSDSSKTGPEWFKSLSGRVDELFGQVRELQTQVTELNTKVSGLESFKAAALRHIHVLRDRLVAHERLPPVPLELQEDVEDMPTE